MNVNGVPSPDVPCTDAPAGTTWYSTVNSNYPWSNTTAAMPYEWVRINWKQNSTQSYMSGGSSATTSNYYVNGSSPSTTSSSPVCFNGGSEVLLNTGPLTNCEQYQSCGAVARILHSSLHGYGACRHGQWVTADGPGGGRPEPSVRDRVPLWD